MNSKPQFAFALEYVSDIQAAKQFYTEVLGLEVERNHPTFVQFKDKSGANYAIASDEAMSERGTLELYWTVDDADAAFSEMSQKAEVTMPLKEMPFGKVFGIRDPAGQDRYVIEMAAIRPSQQV